MSATLNCSACEELRTEVPSLIVNGFDDDMCSSLQNDTGLTTDNDNTDCDDLDLMNDCLVGNMATEVESYDVCDWKTFMKQFIPNVWTTVKGIVCAICGIWTNIHNLWDFVNKLECYIDYMYKGASFSFGEYSTDTSSYIVAGKGVSFANVSASGTANDITLTYIAGGLARITGSLLLYDDDFTDAKEVYNYDNGGVDPTKSSSRKGNSDWNSHDNNPEAGSQLLYELRIKKSDYPQLGTLFSGTGTNGEGGGYHVTYSVVSEGKFANGQSGRCDKNTGDPVASDDDRGHPVPSGWVYIQARVTWIEDLNGNGNQYTPSGFIGIRMNQSAIDCD